MIAHNSGMFKMYSLKWIIDHCTVVKATLGKYVQLEIGREGAVGNPGFGVPVTIKIKGMCLRLCSCPFYGHQCLFFQLCIDTPPLLFEAKSCSNLGLSFGGVPTVYLHNGVPSNASQFHLRSLQTGKLV